MDTTFWQQKWESNDIAFHENIANSLLVKYFDMLSLKKGSRVLLPLCGKTLDIAWLIAHGYRVVGVELSELAVKQLFSQLGVKPIVETLGEIKRFSGTNLDVFVGDIFAVTGDFLAPVDAIYDRAALVALPDGLRNKYTEHLVEISGKVPQLMICYEYDQALMAGPPFSITSEEVNRHYHKHYKLTIIESAVVEGGLKGQCAANENAWLLQRR